MPRRRHLFEPWRHGDVPSPLRGREDPLRHLAPLRAPPQHLGSPWLVAGGFYLWPALLGYRLGQRLVAAVRRER